MLDVLIENRDRRIITPAEILAKVSGVTVLADAEDLADEVSDAIVEMYNPHREPWRQTYAEQLLEGTNRWLYPTRFPIEGNPEVWIGDSVLETGLYRVTQTCRNQLRFDPRVSFSGSRRRVPLFRDHDFGQAPLTSSRERSDYRLPNYTAGYVPPGSIGNREDATAYNPLDSTALGDAQPSWIRRPNRSQLLFECTTAGTSDDSPPTFPNSLEEWAPGFAYSSQQWVAPTTSTLVFEPTTPGLSDADRVPTWPTAEAQTVADGTIVWTARIDMQVTDGTVTWTGRTAREFPRTIRKAALLLARLTLRLELDAKTCEDDVAKKRTIFGLLMRAC
jgi:hypothetical protein